MSKEKSENIVSTDNEMNQLTELLKKGMRFADFFSFCKTHHYKITIIYYRNNYRLLATNKEHEVKVNLGNSVQQAFTKYKIKENKRENTLKALEGEDEVKTRAIEKFILFIRLHNERLMIKTFQKAHRFGHVYSLYLKKK